MISLKEVFESMFMPAKNKKEEIIRTEKKHKVVTICGSFRFYDDMVKLEKALVKNGGFLVMIPYSFVPELNNDPEIVSKKLTQSIHFQKIEMSDAVVVTAIDNYVGSDTDAEIEYATKLHIPVFHYFGEPCFERLVNDIENL